METFFRHPTGPGEKPMFFADAAVEMAILTIVLAVLSFAAQKKFIDQQKQKRDQKRLKEIQGEMKELMRKTDDASMKRLHKVEREMLEITRDMMSGTMKVMLITTPLFLGALWVFHSFYEKAVIALPIPIPWFTNFDFVNPASWIQFSVYHETNWLGWYFLVYLVTNLILTAFWNVYKKPKETA